MGGFTSHGIESMAQILRGKNRLCLIRQYLRLGSHSLVAGVKYKEDLPGYIDGWSMDVISLFRWEGHIPMGEDFKEDFIGVQDRSKKHNALVDAHVARDLYLKLEAGRPHSNGSSTH